MNVDVYSEEYETSAVLQNGNFGAISLSRRKSDGKETVTKVIPVNEIYGEWVSSKRKPGHLVPLEIYLLEHLSHPNIIKLVDFFETSSHFIIVTDRRKAGMDLFDFLNRQPQLNEQLISHIFRQVTSAVTYMHSLNILHGDIKEENVVIDSDFNCVLIDFGSAAYFGPQIAFSSFSGSPQCASPEVLRQELFRGPEQEVWALGILLYTLFHYDYPFHTQQDILNANLTIGSHVSEEMSDVLRSCLHPTSTFRISINELNKLPLLNVDVDLSSYNFFEMLSEDSSSVEDNLLGDVRNISLNSMDDDSSDSTGEDTNSSDSSSDVDQPNSFVESFLSKILL